MKVHCTADTMSCGTHCVGDEMDVDLYSCAQCRIAALPSAETSLPKYILDDCFAIASI